jgi:gamma-glutamyl-gamma-aminobutyrate hydrolase PuuD
VASSASDTGRPLVGLTAYGERTRFGVWDLDAVVLPRAYTDMVLAAGGVPVLVPPRVDAAEAVDRLDAVILSGGPDVEPERYGALPHPRTGSPRHERDAAELAVLERALKLDVPVLAVCRGMQLLNVALGGTLTQHLPEVVAHSGHNPEPGVFGTTTVTLDPASAVGRALGETVVAQCHHHQAIDVLAPGLVATGHAANGTIEAVELSGHPQVLGVQWHPEQDDQRLFTALVAAARKKKRETA